MVERDERVGSDEPRYPSLDVVRAELDMRVQDQARNSTAFDARAGLVLALGGILIGLTPNDPSMLNLFGRVAAAVAAGIAGWSLRFGVGGEIHPLSLRNQLLMEDHEVSKLRILDTRIWLFDQDEARFASKVKTMKFAVWALAVAVLLMLAASIVGYAQ